MASTPPSDPHQPTYFDRGMRIAVRAGLLAVMTSPFWCESIPTGRFAPAQFRSERHSVDATTSPQTTETASALARMIAAHIERAARGSVASEHELSEDLAGVLSQHGVGEESTRGEAALAVAQEIRQQSQETDQGGFADLQREAIQAQSRVMARAMLDRLGALPQSGSDSEVLSWSTLSSFEYSEGMPLPSAVTAFDGKHVRAWGYLLSLSGDQHLLVKSLWSCCFGRAPKMNEGIVVRLNGEGTDLQSKGVEVSGVLEVGEVREDGFVTSIYRIDATEAHEL